MRKKPYKINSFFAGIGGFDVAFEKHGFSTSLLCEINPFCNKILNRHWPKVKKVGDINTITLEEIPDAEVWCGGFPCQDISVARGTSKRLLSIFRFDRGKDARSCHYRKRGRAFYFKQRA